MTIRTRQLTVAQAKAQLQALRQSLPYQRNLIAAEIADDLRSALEQMEAILADLEPSV